MSEATVETVESEVSETPVETPEIVKPELDDLGQMLVTKTAAQIAEYNDLVTRVNRATGDLTKLVSEIREDEKTEDEEVKKFQAWSEAFFEKYNAAVAKIDGYIKENLVKVEMTDDEIKAAEDKAATLDKTIKAARKYGEDYVSGFSLHLPEQKGKVRLAKASGSSDGAPKPRVTGVYVGNVLQSYVTKDGKTKSTFTVAAQFISKDSNTKVEPSAISSAWADAGHFDLAQWKNAPAEVSFVFSAGEKNYDIRVTK